MLTLDQPSIFSFKFEESFNSLVKATHLLIPACYRHYCALDIEREKSSKKCPIFKQHYFCNLVFKKAIPLLLHLPFSFLFQFQIYYYPEASCSVTLSFSLPSFLHQHTLGSLCPCCYVHRGCRALLHSPPFTTLALLPIRIRSHPSPGLPIRLS